MKPRFFSLGFWPWEFFGWQVSIQVTDFAKNLSHLVYLYISYFFNWMVSNVFLFPFPSLLIWGVWHPSMSRYVHTGRGQRWLPSVILYCLPSCFLRKGLFLILELTSWLGSMAVNWKILLPTSLDFFFFLNVSATGLDSELPTYTESTLPTEPYL